MYDTNLEEIVLFFRNRIFKHFLNILKIIICFKIDCRKDTGIVIKERPCIGVTSHDCLSLYTLDRVHLG